MIGYTLAKRYATALIDLAREEKKVDEVGGDLMRLARSFADAPELPALFANPTVQTEVKTAVLEDLLRKTGVQSLTADFAALLLAKKRILGLAEIEQAYRDRLDTLYNRVRARLVSAFPLGAAETERARAALSRLSGKEVILTVETDPGIIGGMVAYVGSHVYDGSVSNQLAQFAESMHKGR